MSTLIAWALSHPAVWGALGALVVSGLVRALPEPVPNGNVAYRVAYQVIHFVAANFDKVASAAKAGK